MKLKFKNPHLSIQEFNEIELPAFTVLTGRNGSGKTHLLQAIEAGHCIIENISPQSIKYFSSGTFKLGAQNSLPKNQLQQKLNQVLHIFDGKSGNPRRNYRSIALSIWNTDIAPLLKDKDGRLLHGFDVFENDLFEPIEDNNEAEAALQIYREKITSQVSTPMAQYLDGQSLCISAQKVKGPFHNLQLEMILPNFVPEVSQSGILNSSLGSLFSQYKINQYNWARQESELNDSDKKFSELLIDYEKINPKPWDLVNEVFAEMNKHSLDGNVFSFEVTNPNDSNVDYRNVETFAFSPQIRDGVTNNVFGFNTLSSGEMVLAALCVTVLEMNSNIGRPKVLLLDEVDASLHPSMIKAMLDTLKSSFLDNDTSIILATHSPSTVSLVDSESLFLVEPKSPKQKILSAKRSEAVSVLTEGLATVNDAKIVFSNLKKLINILTEGYNSVHLKKLLELYNLSDRVGIIEGLEDRTGKSQLHTHAELLACVNVEQTVLFVFDCDAKKQFDQIQETEKIKTFMFEQRTDGFECSGIENMYERQCLEPFLHIKTVIEYRKSTEYKELNDNSKRKFEEHIKNNATLDTFVHFNELKRKIDNILRSLEG